MKMLAKRKQRRKSERDRPLSGIAKGLAIKAFLELAREIGMEMPMARRKGLHNSVARASLQSTPIPPAKLARTAQDMLDLLEVIAGIDDSRRSQTSTPKPGDPNILKSLKRKIEAMWPDISFPDPV